MIPSQIDKKDIKKYSHHLTVGQLKEFLDEHNLPDDAIVMVQRIEDRYFENNNWSVYLKEGEEFYYAIKWNKDIDSEKYHNKKDYPNMKHPEKLKKFSKKELEEMKDQYFPLFCPVYYKDDNDILFLNAHY